MFFYVYICLDIFNFRILLLKRSENHVTKLDLRSYGQLLFSFSLCPIKLELLNYSTLSFIPDIADGRFIQHILISKY